MDQPGVDRGGRVLQANLADPGGALVRVSRLSPHTPANVVGTQVWIGDFDGAGVPARYRVLCSPLVSRAASYGP
jgi:hypothetical protein